MGFGCAAHSCIGGIRYSYVSDVKEYISGIQGEKSIVDEYEIMEQFDRAAEYIMLGMRTAKGISKEEYRRIYRSDFDQFEIILKDFAKKGWAKFENGRWSFTSSGFLLSNTLICILLEAQAEHRLNYNPWVRSTLGTMDDKLTLPRTDKIHIK